MDIGWPEILIIALVILVLFGSKKLPDAARSLGKSMRILKTEVKGLHDDDQPQQSGQQHSGQQQPVAQLPPGTPVPPATPGAVPAPTASAPPTVGERSDTP